MSELVLRPDLRRGWIRLAIGAVLAAAMTGSFAVGYGPEATLVAAVLWGVLLALLAGYLYRARITLTPDEIIVTGLFFRKRRSRGLATRAVRAAVDRPLKLPRDNLFVLDTRGDVLIRMHDLFHTTEDMARLVAALGVPCDRPGGPVTANRLARSYPGILPWYERYPQLSKLLFVCGLLLGLALVLRVVITFATA